MPHFRVKSASVIHETINDEAVVVNLESGTYFSLDGVASYAWDALVAGHSSESVAAELAVGYALDADAVTQQLHGMTDQLLLYDLLVECVPAASPAALPPIRAAGATFPGMQLHVYRDMEELLMLDPIHDVTAAGWPHTPPKS